MWRAFISMWKNTLNYTGKAGRKEFWSASVMNVIAMYVSLIPFSLIILLLKNLISPSVFSVVYIGIFIVPLLSLYVRRANDVGLKGPDILLVAIAVPIVGAMIIGMCPHEAKLPYKGASWCYRCLAIGFGFYFYGGMIGATVLGSFEAVTPIVAFGLIIMTITIITGAVSIIIGKGRNKEKRTDR